MSKPTVIVVGADKGGVGKTTVSRTLLDYFSAHNVPTRAFDTEAPRGTLKRFHPDVTDVVDVTSVSDQMLIFDTIGTAEAKVTVIDVRAGLLSPTLRALRDIGFLDAAKRASSPSPSSIPSARRSPRSTRSRKPRASSVTRAISW